MAEGCNFRDVRSFATRVPTYHPGMRAMKLVLAVIATMRVGSATADGAPQMAGCAAESPHVRSLRAVAEGIVAADNRRDLAAVLEFYEPDAILMPPGELAVKGRERIKPRYEQLFAAYSPAIRTDVQEACADSDFGFVRGRNTGRFVPRTDAAARDLDDAFLMLLRRDAAGVWRISHLIWHRQSAVSQSPPRP
jgi:uncharacterized protein (TIGR02246 family)